MSAKIIPATPYKSQKAAQDAFYGRYGAALSAWADIEHVLSLWFTYATGCEQTHAHTMQCVSSANSFKGSARMLIAAFRAQRRADALSAFFGPAINLTEGGYYSFRNQLAHNLTVYRVQYGRAVLQKGDDPLGREGEIGERDLVIATRNFIRLRRIWRDTLPSLLPKPRLTPEEGLRRIQGLPALASSSELGRKRKR